VANKLVRQLAEAYRIDDGDTFRLKDFDPDDTGELASKEAAGELLKAGITRLAELQDVLYAQDRWGVLLIFQAMDAAGKDGVIKHVMSGVNPQGCQIFSFKAPSNEELDHDFLWRTSKSLPERGRIGIFNRSYYEETLVVRVHPRVPERAAPAGRGRDEGHLARALRGRQRLRALPLAQRLRDPEVLPERLEEGAEEALPEAP
jgi:polyphosphate kinase 2 (PPK2 family)